MSDYNYFLNTYGDETPVGFESLCSQAADEMKNFIRSIGSFYNDELPQLNGFEDAGTVAFSKTLHQYVTWDGYGWTANGKPVTPRYLTFTSNQNNSEVAAFVLNDGYELPEEYKFPNLEYSTDGGQTWEAYELVYTDDETDSLVLTIDEGESVMFRGENDNLAYYIEDESDYLKVIFYIDGSVAASGDVTSLLNRIGGDVILSESCYISMFSGCTGLTQAPALPATTLANDCYNGMFDGCTGLTQAPDLPATTLANNCYQNMFNGCTSLTQAPDLPATTLATSCYSGMFSGCTGLTQAPVLPATTLAQYCYRNMFNGCTGLTQAPALPATTLAEGCYYSMFSGCTSLTSAPALPSTTLAVYCYNSMFSGCTGLAQAPALPATTLVQYCYQNMFNGCTSLTQAPALPATTLADGCYNAMFYNCEGITSHHVATMNNSTNVFGENTACEGFTIDDVTPPTIANSTISGLKSDCVIYVPSESVDAYKAAQYWAVRAEYIQAKPVE